MKIYTRTGDEGETGLFGGPRVSKDDRRIEAYGTVDELNAVLGVVRAGGVDPELDELLATIQHELFDVGAELATPDPGSFGLRCVASAEVARLEWIIDRAEEDLAPLKQFVLPGGCPAAARLHVARTVCRRAERRVISLAREPGAQISSWLVVYLNRLSDLLFVLARWANARSGVADVPWQKPSERAAAPGRFGPRSV